ncbi:MAG: hypothetical protein RIQ56_544 [Candidatus Parcubacteria bacterium]|jgi:hypothetical protein
MNYFHSTRTQGRRGFTLLLAALIASIVLSLGASIYAIATKQITLASLGRDSQFAFYAADLAAECALYWDLRHDYFATTTPNVSPPDPQCAGQSFTASGRSAVFPYTMAFEFEPGGLCADVYVEKTQDAQSVIHTTIHADGYSTSCAGRTTSPRALQRSVELHY